MHKLKTTKTNEERKVNLYPEIKPALMKLLADNPHKVDDPFVFYSIYPDQPMDGKILLKGLCEACEAAGIDNKERNICVHSHRHFWAAHMTTSMNKDKLMKITGHRTTAIYDEYANHEESRNLEEVGKVGSQIFGKSCNSRRGHNMIVVILKYEYYEDRIGNTSDAVNLLTEMIEMPPKTKNI